MQTLFTFMQEKIDTLPDAPVPSSRTEPKPEHHKRNQAPVHTIQPPPSFKRSNCSLCNGDKHSLYLCPTYISMSVENRSNYVRSAHLCFNCFGYGRMTRECHNTGGCKKCSKVHHTTLHRETAPSCSTEPAPYLFPLETASVNTVGSKTAQAMLQMTSQVILESLSGKKLTAQALLDTGASISLVTRRVVQCLQLHKNPQDLLISGAQGSTTGSSSHSVNISVVNKVTCDLPLQGAPHVRQLPHLKDLELPSTSLVRWIS